MFFTGKGGVGKTSLSCASAIELVKRGKKVLLVSTDPASNIGQVFNQQIGDSITPIGLLEGLFSLEIDPQEAAMKYRERIISPVRQLLPKEVVDNIQEQLSGACTTEIAAFDEFTALLSNEGLIKDYDHIIFDTAPTGHTIRLLQLPRAWSNFIEKNPQGASCLGPLSGLEKQRSHYAKAVKALADSERSRLVLVSRAQKTALEEVASTHEELLEIGLDNQFLVINALLPKPEHSQDELYNALYQKEQIAISNLNTKLANLPIDYLNLRPFNMVGIEALSQLFKKQDLEEKQEFINFPAPNLNIEIPNLVSLVDQLSQSKSGLIMMMGKGGVGKTTLASAIALELSKRGFMVHLTTSDPASHLGVTLSESVDNLEVSRIDPKLETQLYARDVLATKGQSLDLQGRQMLEEDLRSPCTEEIAVFQKFAQIIKQADDRFVIMDTAPTGHTLLLLESIQAYNLEIERNDRNHEEKNSELNSMNRLQNPDLTKVIIVTLAETTPVLEASQLQQDLQRAGIQPWAWVVNNSLISCETSSTLLRQRGIYEIEHIQNISQNLSKQVFILPIQPQEPVGNKALTRLFSPS